jgi:arylsulfatase A-like enzyme
MTSSRSRILCLLTVVAFFLTACLPTIPWIEPSATATPTITETPLPTQTPTPTFPPTSTLTVTPTPRPAITRVFILSVDGMRPEAISMAPMPVLASLMQAGAYTLTAQTIYPSSTLPAHASMLTGVCPAKHGVTWNDYLPENGYAAGTDLFDIAHAAGLKTAMFVGKKKLRQITEPSSTDIFEYINDRDTVITDRVIEQFPKDFGVLFIHFPTPDGMGHEYGWLSFEQLSVLRRADESLGRLLDTLDTDGLRGETLVIVTADHGGHDTTHGSTRPEDMTIPWVIAGPGVQPMELTTPVRTMDTAATAAWALGLPIPPEWDGIPVTEAFGIVEEPHPAEVCH